MYLLMTHEAGLSINDLRALNFGTALDYVYKYIEFHKPKKEKRMREATPEEVRRFLGGS